MGEQVIKNAWVPHPYALLADGWGAVGLRRKFLTALTFGQGPMGFDFDRGSFAGQPMAVAAPGPIFGLFDQTPRDWVAMDVAELLCDLRLRQDVEVVIAPLPELRAVVFQPLRCLVLENIQRGRKGVDFGLGEQKMDMLRHEDVSEDIEAVIGAELFELFKESCARRIVIEIRQTAVATKSEEVVAALRLIPL